MQTLYKECNSIESIYLKESHLYYAHAKPMNKKVTF